jgi:imidazolonepropionase-like amidohydrolase
MALTAACWLAAGTAIAGSAAQWVVLSNDEVVGSLEAQTEGGSVTVNYRVDNNGRGPKIDETLELDERGYPRSWSISGSSLFGATVDEAYRWQDGESSWHSQADRGSRPDEKPAMYIGGDASPWAYGMYARALLAAPDRTLSVLPSGHMKLRELETLSLGDDGPAVRLCEISGIQLEPQLIAVDADGGLFARFGGSGGLIRKGYETALAQLNDWARGYELRRLHAMQARLAHPFEQPLRYRDVHVFDPYSGTTGEAVSVLVSDGRIEAVDPDPAAGDPDSEVIVDGEGGTLLPGLYDMHAHNSLDGGLFYLAAGVTSTRDMGNDNELLAEIIRARKAGELAGPRITAAGMIEARSPYSVRLGIVADTLDEALEAARWYRAHDYREIKIYNSMKPEWLAPLAAEAKRLGLGVTGHVPAFVHPDEAILDGYNSIAHINQLMLGWLLEEGEDTRTPLRLTAMKRAVNLDLDDPRVKKTVALMLEHGTALDTTAVILERLMISRAGEVNPGDRPYLDHMPIGYQRYRKRTFVPLSGPADDAAYRDSFDVLLKTIRMLHDSGVTLLVSTDDATGFTVHRELELYVQAGIPAAETLRIATLGAARYLDQEGELGSIEPGKRADFFLVPGDPAQHISAVREIRLVSLGGIVYFPEEIYRELGIEPFAPAVELQVPVGAAP